jgi:hypothetical protein
MDNIGKPFFSFKGFKTAIKVQARTIKSILRHFKRLKKHFDIMVSKLYKNLLKRLKLI